MLRKPVKKKLSLEIRPAPLELHALLAHLKEAGVDLQTRERIFALWEARLQRENDLLGQLERAARVHMTLLKQLSQGELPVEDLLEELTRAVRRISNLHADLDFEKRQVWIAVAKESGRPEIARGISGLRRGIIDEKVVKSRPAAISIVESTRAHITESAAALKRIRKEAGLTLAQVASASRLLFPMTKEAQITAPHLHKAENARGLLSPLKLMVLSQVYEMSFDLFLASLGLDYLKPLIRELARDLILGAYRDVNEASADREIKIETDLGELEASYSSLEEELSKAVTERDSLKRHVEFLEREIEALRSGIKGTHAPRRGRRSSSDRT